MEAPDQIPEEIDDLTDDLSDEALDRDEGRGNSHASLPWRQDNR